MQAEVFHNGAVIKLTGTPTEIAEALKLLTTSTVPHVPVPVAPDVFPTPYNPDSYPTIIWWEQTREQTHIGCIHVPADGPMGLVCPQCQPTSSCYVNQTDMQCSFTEDPSVTVPHCIPFNWSPSVNTGDVYVVCESN